MTSIFFVRHGLTEWNQKKLLQGHCDIPLSELGKLQALALRNQLEGVSFSKVYSSDLKRALETASLISNSNSIIIDQRLRERYYGEWEGKLSLDFKMCKEEKRGVETLDQVLQRMQNFLFDVSHLEGNILVVSHGGSIRTLLGHFFSLPSEDIFFGNCAYCHLKKVNTRWVIQKEQGIEWSKPEVPVS